MCILTTGNRDSGCWILKPHLWILDSRTWSASSRVTERERAWTTLEGLLHGQSPTRQTCEENESYRWAQSQNCCQNESCTRTEQDCPLEQWSSHTGAYDKLALLPCKYLATPATAVPCERLFSGASDIVNKKRPAVLLDNVWKESLLILTMTLV